MHYILTAVAFLLIFSLLVLIHEFGHFIMAKRAGIKVEEFGFGLPPRIWGKKKGETIYSINWIPFGGFVKMLGEDDPSGKSSKNKRSFAAKPVSARIKVVVAGVIMNFFLAWLFLTIGFTYGMQPLLLPNEIFGAIDDGTITLSQGAVIEKIDPNYAAYKAGMREGDIVYSHGDAVLDSYAVDKLKEPVYDNLGKYIVYRDGQKLEIEVKDEGALGIEFYDYADFPRVKIYDIDERSDLYKSGLKRGDIVLALNGMQLFDVSEYQYIARQSETLNFTVYRDGQNMEVAVPNLYFDRILVSKVYPLTPAQKIGLKDGDFIISVDGQKFHDPSKIVAYTEENSAKEIEYVVDRAGEILTFKIKPEDKKIGVLLSALNAEKQIDDGVSFYDADVLSSAVKIQEQKYPFYVSAYKSFSEMYKLSKVTAVMFLGMISDVFLTGQVPDSVSGPVGIAQMTYSIITEGMIVILRFIALLSLSLAVINILPLPALDGGRFLFLLFELITGRRVSAKWENRIHTVGYVLIIFLILLVTYSDIVKVIKGV
ncbi:MAG: RIP metalloprotease RseP [Candidatus Gracilibacteria bacterium]|jgi:regulator of sigma E protease